MNTLAHHRSPWRRNSLLALLLLGLGVGAWMLVHRVHPSPDHPGHDEVAARTLNDGRRWETDLPLRTGMQRIRNAVDQTFAARASGRLTPAETRALSATVQENVNYLIANCKLPPKADATLHGLITEMLSGAAQLAENPGDQKAWEGLAQALRDYSEYFDHPGWVTFDAPTR